MSFLAATTSRPNSITSANRCEVSSAKVCQDGTLAVLGKTTSDYLYISGTVTPASFAPASSGPSGVWDFAGIDLSDDGQTIVIGGNTEDDAVWLSDDGGDTWTEQTDIGQTSDHWHVAISGDGQTIYACDNINAVWVTTNGGIDWTEPSFQPILFGEVDCILINRSNPQSAILFTVDDDYYLSDDFGVTWILGNRIDGTQRNASADLTYIYNIDDAGTLSKTTDLGLTWTPIATEKTNASFVCSDDGEEIILFSNCGPEYSEDFGETWEPFEYGNACDNLISASGDLSVLLATSDSSMLYLSTDGGETWTNSVLSE